MAFTSSTTQIIGANLCKDATIKTFDDGPRPRTVAYMSVAQNRSVKGSDGQYHDETDFYSVEYWNVNPGLAAKLTKGQKVAIVGEQSHRKYTDRDGKERLDCHIRATNVILIGAPKQSSGYDYDQNQPETNFNTSTLDNAPF